MHPDYILNYIPTNRREIEFYVALFITQGAFEMLFPPNSVSTTMLSCFGGGKYVLPS